MEVGRHCQSQRWSADDLSMLRAAWLVLLQTCGLGSQKIVRTLNGPPHVSEMKSTCYALSDGMLAVR